MTDKTVKIRHSIGPLIRDLMKKSVPRITQESMAEQIGIHQSTLALKLSGDRSFDQAEIMRIAEILQIHPAALLFDFGDPALISPVLDSLGTDPALFHAMAAFPDEIRQVLEMLREAEDPRALMAGLRFALSMYKDKN